MGEVGEVVGAAIDLWQWLIILLLAITSAWQWREMWRLDARVKALETTREAGGDG